MSVSPSDGIIQFFSNELFAEIKRSCKKVEVCVSFLEIYNEIVVDLLHKDKTQLQVVDDPVKGVHAAQLSHLNVTSSQEMLEVINFGHLRRTQAETATNKVSSRSHAIITVSVTNLMNVTH